MTEKDCKHYMRLSYNLEISDTTSISDSVEITIYNEFQILVEAVDNGLSSSPNETKFTR